MRKLLVWGLWILFAAIVAAGAFFAWRTLRGQEAPAAGTAVILVCNQTCADRAQCGTTMQSPEVPVILAGSNAPAVEPDQHDLFFPNRAQAEVRETMTVTLEEGDGTRFDHPFSRVEYRNPLNDIVSGWVPDWCIERP